LRRNASAQATPAWLAPITTTESNDLPPTLTPDDNGKILPPVNPQIDAKTPMPAGWKQLHAGTKDGKAEDGMMTEVGDAGILAELHQWQMG
jgi:hypothetical protein